MFSSIFKNFPVFPRIFQYFSEFFSIFQYVSVFFQYYPVFPVFSRSQVDSLVEDHMFDNWDDEDFGFYDTDSDEEAGTKVCSARDYRCFFAEEQFHCKMISSKLAVL